MQELGVTFWASHFEEKVCNRLTWLGGGELVCHTQLAFQQGCEIARVRGLGKANKSLGLGSCRAPKAQGLIGGSSACASLSNFFQDVSSVHVGSWIKHIPLTQVTCSLYIRH